METNILQPVTFTEGALQELKKILLQKQENQALRVGVKGGGCSGMTYVLAVDHIGENDDIYEIQGIQVVMNKAHELYVLGMEIDWQDGLNSRGFTFTNPNAKTTCGCGTSFSA